MSVSLAPRDFRHLQVQATAEPNLTVGFSHLNPTSAYKAFCGSRPWSNSIFCWETEQCPLLIITVRIIAKQRYIFLSYTGYKKKQMYFPIRQIEINLNLQIICSAQLAIFSGQLKQNENSSNQFRNQVNRIVFILHISKILTTSVKTSLLFLQFCMSQEHKKSVSK